MEPEFFKSVTELHKWFQKNHNKLHQILIGFYNKQSGKGGATYKEALDEALCYGWIDGIRKNVDEYSYSIRFTPRKEKSIWSNVNVKRFKELTKLQKVEPSGLLAFNKKDEKRAGIYAYEQNIHTLLTAYEKKLKTNKKAWKYFCNKAPWYKRTCIYWVMSAKQEVTQLKRLQTLINDSANEQTIAQFTRNPKK